MHRHIPCSIATLLLAIVTVCWTVDVQAGIGGFLFRKAAESVPKAMDAGKKVFGKIGFQRYSAFEKELIRSGTKATVAGRLVVKRNQTFDSNARDALGRTNTQRMRDGFAPIGRDGRPVELHHMGQKNDGLIVEITSAQHRGNTADLHRHRNKSEIDRQRFNEWKKEYWKKRAEDFR